ncbi:energy-coupling factor ABC transporter substrate-binding protein [Sporolituus thermophilus]|uniref:Cobalt transport protein CbiN n=1 Tax=Sporolituus thermophilus DSM 23256 TaxID=1123285 RepID=A0A1G7HR72_9FIRM|nr:energy-coupling factor ABC transporter substrate-binding protein [Sporolituus thermophilus]SDF03027.1 cobalt/nickel transport protein [Sporolituus thermophilus DSM 23256]
MILRQNIILLALAIILAVLPLAVQQDADFGGADDKVKDIIAGIRPDYQPWFTSLWEPPSAEVASFLFAVQAALGAGIIGYFFGYQRGKAGRKYEV